MVDDNKQFAHFSICGSFDPAQLTDQIGLQPTDSWRQGDIDPKTRYERKSSRWSLRSTLPDTERLEAHSRDVLAQLDSRREALYSARREDTE